MSARMDLAGEDALIFFLYERIPALFCIAFCLRESFTKRAIILLSDISITFCQFPGGRRSAGDLIRKLRSSS